MRNYRLIKATSICHPDLDSEDILLSISPEHLGKDLYGKLNPPTFLDSRYAEVTRHLVDAIPA